MIPEQAIVAWRQKIPWAANALVEFMERILKVAARILLSTRRVTFVVSAAAARYWRPLLIRLEKLPSVM